MSVLIPESKVKEIKQDLDLILKEGEKMEITNVETYKEAIGFLAKVTKRLSRFEDMKDELLKPIQNSLKDAVNKFKMMEEPYEKAAEPLRKRANEFVDDFMTKFMEKADKAKEPMEVPDLSVRTEAGLAYVTSSEAIELEDINLVPKEYLVTSVDMAKVKAALKAGEENIPGIKIRRKYSIGLRQ